MKFLPVYKWTLYGIFCVITLYGLFLTLIPGLNPYKMIEQPMFGQEFNMAYAMGLSGVADVNYGTQMNEGRMFGRISSFFDHPMTYGLNLGFFFIYAFYILKNKTKYLIPTLIIILAAIVTCGVRTAIAALVVTVLFALLYLRKFKYFAYGSIISIVLIIIIPLISQDMTDYIMSITADKEDTEVKGSSLEMRLEQLNGCIEIVKEDFIMGKGLGWAENYNAIHGVHPTALWFESIIFKVIVDSGIFGFFVWSIFLTGYYKFAKRIKDRFLRLAIISLMVYFLVYCTITGDFNIKNLFPFFTILICLGLMPKNKIYAIKDKPKKQRRVRTNSR